MSERPLVFLVTAETPTERLRLIDEASEGFTYAVSSAGVTGGSLAIDTGRLEYLQRLRANVKAPLMVGVWHQQPRTIQCCNPIC